MKAWFKDFIKNLKADLKRMHASLTIWFNGIVGGLALAVPEAVAAFPQLQEYVSPEFYKQMMVVLLVGNFLLRFRTSRPLRDK
ncbi:MAG: hypothetical protein WCT35_04960 [Sideroxydans sp.]|jgi:hypothetical protein